MLTLVPLVTVGQCVPAMGLVVVVHRINSPAVVADVSIAAVAGLVNLAIIFVQNN